MYSDTEAHFKNFASFGLSRFDHPSLSFQASCARVPVYVVRQCLTDTATAHRIAKPWHTCCDLTNGGRAGLNEVRLREYADELALINHEYGLHLPGDQACPIHVRVRSDYGVVGFCGVTASKAPGARTYHHKREADC